MGTIKFLTEDELALLLYIVNVEEPISKMEIGVKELPWIRQEYLVAKITKQENKMTPEGLEVLKTLGAKVTRHSIHETQENENSLRNPSHQTMFQF